MLLERKILRPVSSTCPVSQTCVTVAGCPPVVSPQGFTVFLERKILGRLHGPATLQYHAANGFMDLQVGGRGRLAGAWYVRTNTSCCNDETFAPD